MMKRLGMAMAMGALLGACGGSSAPHNAAAGKTFDYGTSVAASTEQASAVQGAVSGALALKSSPDATQAQDLADISGITAALLGDSDLAIASLRATVAGRTAALVARRSGLAAPTPAAGGFDNPACIVVTPSSVTLTGCKLTVVSGTTTDTVTADGSFTVAADTLTWELSVQMRISDTAHGSVVSANLHDSGTLTVTATTAQGSLRRELAASATAPGQSAGLGVSESVDFDVTHDQGCVTGGTLEAKRVWSERPPGQSAASLPDRGAKVTWTACGVATIQLSR